MNTNDSLPTGTEINRDHQPASWIKPVLIAAAIYNLAWGAFAILSPLSIFKWLQFDPLPVYPELWQCIGMIVGVYGVGYAVAAADPYRHWPIVLVGLLGKILGPVGFLGAVLDGRLPAAMGWTILTNDVIWWVPFGVILWRAGLASRSRGQQQTTDPVGSAGEWCSDATQ